MLIQLYEDYVKYNIYAKIAIIALVLSLGYFLFQSSVDTNDYLESQMNNETKENFHSEFDDMPDEYKSLRNKQ